MKKLILLTLFLATVFVGYSQQKGFTSDAYVVRQNKNSVTVKGSGLHEKKKFAEQVAIRSAFHTYLTVGLQGLNNNRPLVDQKMQSDPRVASYINDIVDRRYTVFIGNVVADDKPDKGVDKMFKVFVTFELYSDALLRDMASNGIIAKPDNLTSMAETSDNMIMPTIMIIPHTADGQTIKQVLDTKSEYRATANKLAEAFLNEGVETKNFEEQYNGLVLSGALSSSMSSDDQILSQVSRGVDVIVYMDIKSSVNGSGTSAELILTAVDAATKSTIATATESSARFKNATPSNLSMLLAGEMTPNFIKQISTSFARNTSRGQGISIRFELDPNSSSNFDSELGSDIYTLGDLMRLWIKENAKGGRYRTASQTSTLIIYDQIFISTQDQGGNFSDVNDFELVLRKYLRDNSITISRRLMDGNSITYTLTL